MTRRPGLTLVEVLTAIFIVGLGAVAILTLFPHGAAQFGNAVKDSRCAECAFNAEAYMRTYWKTEIVEKAGGTDTFFQALTDPNAGLAAGSGLTQAAGGALPPAAGNEASYPVFVDSMGYVARALYGKAQHWVGEPGTETFIRRTSINPVATSTNPQQAALRLFSLMDTLGYDENGTPDANREMRYNWLYVLQRPNNANLFTASLTVVAFDRRAHLYPQSASETVLTSTNLGTSPGSSSVTFTTTPDLKPGTWILDATISAVATSKVRNANFYRVVTVDANTNTVELQTPIKVPTGGGNAAYTGTFVVMKGVANVYTMSPLTAGD
jgi:prepilin-type N-terminal cleavage/methylation domain-containing protein